MQFDITEIDKALLLQALYHFSEPVGLGVVEYGVNKIKGINVDGLQKDEAQELIDTAEIKSFDNYIQVVDYYKGKPIKFSYSKNRKGREFSDSLRYDNRNGKYRFFEAMLKTFHFDDIFITKRSYLRRLKDLLEEAPLKRSEAQLNLFKTLIKSAKEIKDYRGTYYLLDKNLKSLPELLYEV